MSLFNSQTAQEIWIDNWCHRCWQPDEAARREHGKDTQCPIQAKALASYRKPVEWKRNPRASVMVEAYKCEAYQERPAKGSQKTQHFDDVPMLDVQPHEAPLIPVEGWPERPKKDGVDHA